jgi:hypothetical protein
MPTKYLYIDDDRYETVRAYINTLEAQSEEKFKIHHRQVMNIKDVVNLIREEGFKGVIIDQQLTAESDDNLKVDYFGTTLAQHLRTVMAIGEIAVMPLILLSNEERIVESFTPDDSSHDLFDYVIKKNKLADRGIPKKAAESLNELIHAYKLANEVHNKNGEDLHDNSIMTILGIDEAKFEQVDKRFIDFIKAKSHDTHAVVSAIYSTLVRSAGMLVTEKMLLTRLGIDQSTSADWENLKPRFDNCLYKGIFSTKKRWWFSSIEDWWFSISPENPILQSLDVNERVEILKQKTNLMGLKPITLSYKGNQSSHLWINCVATDVPLDPYDALRARDPDLKPWEQPKYLDLLAVLEGKTGKYSVHIEDRTKRLTLKARLKPDA